ncbi:tail fiber assembly protein [Escherichia coli]|nr:tail fiber assembly protein [Escherichia coli]
MTDIKNFREYTPENPPVAWALYLISEDGQDWYECQKQFADRTYKIAYDSNNIVRSITTDVSALCPVNMSVAEVDTLPDGVNIEGGWYYQNGEVLPVPVDYSQQAEKQRQRLLAVANGTTSDWKTELELGIISDADKARLVLWMAYIKALRTLDFSTVTDKASYDAIQWPETPEQSATGEGLK